MQLSETMKDVLKQLCLFEKQLAKHRKRGLGIFYTTKIGTRLMCDLPSFFLANLWSTFKIVIYHN